LVEKGCFNGVGWLITREFEAKPESEGLLLLAVHLSRLTVGARFELGFLCLCTIHTYLSADPFMMEGSKLR
jgi:hypothetical protein